MFSLLMVLACGGSTVAEKEAEVPDPVRMVLHEAFSGSNCGPCAPAAENLDAALTERDGEYAMLKFQIGSDPYITREAVRRIMYYLPDAETYSIPWVMADGVHDFHPNEMDHGGVYLAEDFDEFVAIPVSLGIDVSMTVTDQTVDIEVELQPIADIAGEDLRMMVAVKEYTTFNNVGSNGQSEFHDVFKKFVPSEAGTILEPLVAGENTTHTFQHVFPGEYDSEAAYGREVDHETAHTVEEFSDLGVVVWVQDMVSGEVFNTGEAGGH